MIVHQSTLNAILAADPDGGEREPRTGDYNAFRAFVVTHYGVETYAAYRAGELRTSPHNTNGTSDDFYG